MSEVNRFVVEVVGRLNEAHEVTVSRVSSALGLEESRAAALVARMPGVITRPTGEDRAMKVALRLQEAGVPALHRPISEHEDPFKTAERPAARVEPATPREVPSLDATHHDAEPDPKLTPMSEAGFGAADIVIPTHTPAGERPRPRATFVEAGSTAGPSEPGAVPPPAPADTAAGAADAAVDAGGAAAADRAADDAAGEVDPAQTMVRPASERPTPVPGATPLPEVALTTGAASTDPRPLTPVGPALATGSGAPSAGSEGRQGARRGAGAQGRGAPAPDAQAPAAPVYRQTRSAAEPPLTLSAPPEDVLQRSGVPETQLPSRANRRRGRFGRHLAAQVALPGLLTWSLTAVALWWFLGTDRAELFVVLAAATAVAALVGSLIAALGTVGVARDVLRLRDEARRIAMGELTAPVGSNRDDELGEIAGSLERMRLSLQEGLERLRRRTKA